MIAAKRAAVIEPARQSRPAKAATQPRRREQTLLDKPRLLLCGDPDRRKAMVRSLERIEAEIVQFDGLPAKRGDTIGVVLAPPFEGIPAPIAIRRCRRRTGSQTPVFVIVDTRISDRNVRLLYDAGAEAVFHWPREALMLPGLIAELVGIRLVRGPAGRSDRALARAVTAHLRLLPTPHQGLRVDATDDGVVRFSGSVPTLRRKREIQQTGMRVPGVRGVDTHDLWVEPGPVTDRQLVANVRALLRSATQSDEATVSAAVHGGTVTLAGTVGERGENRRLLALVSELNGVREIHDTIVVSAKANRRDRMVVRRLRKIVRDLFPRERVEVAAFGRHVVLTGKVRHLARRKEIEFAIERDPSIERVVNKIEIAQ